MEGATSPHGSLLVPLSYFHWWWSFCWNLCWCLVVPTGSPSMMHSTGFAWSIQALLSLRRPRPADLNHGGKGWSHRALPVSSCWCVLVLEDQAPVETSVFLGGVWILTFPPNRNIWIHQWNHECGVNSWRFYWRSVSCAARCENVHQSGIFYISSPFVSDFSEIY